MVCFFREERGNQVLATTFAFFFLAAADCCFMRLSRNGEAAPQEVGCVRVAVTDSGCGIEEDSQERVFTPFYTTKPEGTGLGLSVVHGMVTEHGGEIDITSAVGEGTTVVVTLPLAEHFATAKEVN